jgi:hypothetical protein
MLRSLQGRSSVCCSRREGVTIAMSRPTNQGQHCALRHRLTSTLAALLLILHWAAPSFRPLDLPQPSGEPIPAYSPAEIGPRHGTLPRLLAGMQGVEVTLPKPKRNDVSSDGSDEGLPGGPQFTPGRDNAMALTAAPQAPRIAATVRPFQARAPPAAAA